MEHLDKDLLWSRKYQKLKDKLVRRAVLLQARENNRRLDELNHESARILAAQERSVSVDRFEGVVGQIYEKMDATVRELRKDIIDLKDYKQKQEGKGQGGKDIMDIIKLIIIVAGFFIAYFVIKK